MRLGDRFYRAMSEWGGNIRSRSLATEENAYELYWFNQIDRFYGPEVNAKIYCTRGSVSYLLRDNDYYVFVVTLPRKWRNPTHAIYLYFDSKTGEYVDMKRSLKRKLRDDELEELRSLANGYFQRLHKYKFMAD